MRTMNDSQIFRVFHILFAVPNDLKDRFRHRHHYIKAPTSGNTAHGALHQIDFENSSDCILQSLAGHKFRYSLGFDFYHFNCLGGLPFLAFLLSTLKVLNPMSLSVSFSSNMYDRRQEAKNADSLVITGAGGRNRTDTD